MRIAETPKKKNTDVLSSLPSLVVGCLPLEEPVLQQHTLTWRKREEKRREKEEKKEEKKKEKKKKEKKKRLKLKFKTGIFSNESHKPLLFECKLQHLNPPQEIIVQILGRELVTLKLCDLRLQ